VRLLRLQNLVTLYKALGGGLREHTTAAQTTLEPSRSESLPTHSGPSASN